MDFCVSHFGKQYRCHNAFENPPLSGLLENKMAANKTYSLSVYFASSCVVMIILNVGQFDSYDHVGYF